VHESCTLTSEQIGMKPEQQLRLSIGDDLSKTTLYPNGFTWLPIFPWLILSVMPF